MKKLVLAVLLVATAAPARATSTSRLLGLDIIPVGTLSWGPRDNNRIYQISSAAASQYDSNTFGLNGSTQTSRGAWLFNNGSSITFATGSAFYLAPATAYTSTITAAGIAEAYGVTASTMGIGGSPSGTRKFQVYFNANNNSPSYGDGAVRYLDSVNGVGFECGALYGGSQPSWCQSGNDGMGSKKPFVFQPDGSNVGIRTLSPATTAALEVAGPVSVGGSGATQYSIEASSGIKAKLFVGDGSQLTGIVTGGGGHIYSTATVSGTTASRTGQFVVPVETGTVFDAAGFGLYDDPTTGNTVIKVKNIMSLAIAASYPGGSETATTLSACLANSTAPFNTGNNPALVCYAGSAKTVGGSINVASGILVDGVMISSVTQIGNSVNGVNLSFCAITPTLSAGSHNACVAFAVPSGSIVIPDASGTNHSGSKLSVVEINTSGSGYSAPASTAGFWSTGTTGSLTYGACTGSTYTLTTSGAPLLVNMSGAIDSNATSRAQMWVLMDGAPLPGFNSTHPMTDFAGNSAGSSASLSAPPQLVTASAGTHNFCVTAAENGGTLSCNTGPCYLSVQEVRNAAGTGDVSSNGNNGFSGNNTHSGTEAFNSTATFTVSPSSNTAPTANALYSMFIPKVSIIFDQSTSSVTTYGAINVTSATWVATGRIRFNLVSPMSGHRYMCNCFARVRNSGSAPTICGAWYDPNTLSVEVLNETVTPSAVNMDNGGMVQCWDYGDTKQ
jgi:hypothetical protein